MAVKGKLLIILSGVALLHLFLLGGLALSGGCSSDDEQPINDQNYVPAPTAESNAPAGSPAPVTEFNNAPAAAPGVGFSTSSPLSTQVNDFGPVAKGEAVKYTVQKGDSPWKIAKKYGVSVEELLSYNQTSAKTMKVGQVLTIPPGGKAFDANEKVSDKKHSGKKASPEVSSVSPEVKHAAKKTEEHVASGSGETYAVQKGDTLDKIAHKFHVKAADIASASNISVDKMLQVGQKLTIPKSGAVAAKTEKSEKAVKSEKVDKADKADKAGEKKDKKDSASAKKGGKDAAAEKAGDAKSDSKPAAPAKTGDSLLDEIPSPDEGPSAGNGNGTVKPLASNAAVNSAASVAGEKVAASSGYTAEVDQDSTVEKLATQYGCKAEDIKKLNPELPADGKVKAGSVIKIP
jgi:LysM repeat protein